MKNIAIEEKFHTKLKNLAKKRKMSLQSYTEYLLDHESRFDDLIYSLSLLDKGESYTIEFPNKLMVLNAQEVLNIE